jgi:hypothetical protein
MATSVIMLDQARSFMNRHVHALLFVAASLYCCVGWSVCPSHKFTEPSDIKLKGNSVMIVVHASAQYDARFTSKRSLNVTYFMDAIYSNGKSIEPSDPFYSDFARFLNIVTYGPRMESADAFISFHRFRRQPVLPA